MKRIYTRGCDCGRVTFGSEIGLAAGTRLCTCSFNTRTRWPGAAAASPMTRYWPAIRY